MKRPIDFVCWGTILFGLFLQFDTTSSNKNNDAKKNLNNIHSNDIVSDNKDNEDVTINATIVEEVLIEDNPDYLGRSLLVEDDDSNCSDYDSDLSDDEDSKGEQLLLNKELTRRNAKKNISKVLKASKIKYTLKKHRFQITLAVFLFAFRKEIFLLVRHLMKRHVIPTSSPTGFLKLLLFIDFMRRLRVGELSSGTNSRVASLCSLLGKGNSTFPMYNPAYVPTIKQHFTFERINEFYVKDGLALRKAIHSEHKRFKWPSSPSSFVPGDVSNREKTRKDVLTSNETVIILDWTNLDPSITKMEQLRHEISFLLSEYSSFAMDENDNPQDTGYKHFEVVVLLESPGGSVADYGLAGSHLLRLRNTPGITLTVCVDKVAASGGYLLCCTASPGKLFAAPFAMIGSIGVISQLMNIQNLLEGWRILPLVFRAGKDKSPVGLIGDVTKSGKETTQKMLDETHNVFKQHVIKARPVLRSTIDQIGSGNVWLGVDALELKLIDAVKTSDEYIAEKVKQGARVLKMIASPRPLFLFGNRGIGGFESTTFSPFCRFGQKMKSLFQKSWFTSLRFCSENLHPQVLKA